MDVRSDNSTEDIDQQAADWFTLLRSSDCTVATEQRLNAWLDSDPAHARAYRHIEDLWHNLGHLESTPELEMLRRSADAEILANKSEASQSWLHGVFASLFEHKAGFAAVAAAVILATVFLLPQPVDEVIVAEHRSLTGEIRQVALDGGKTRLTLAPETHLNVRATDLARHVELVSGEAFFEVASDPERPFFVLADDTLVKVVGTKFDVRRGPGVVSVAVLEGVVNVIESAAAGAIGTARESVVLGEGQRVSKPGGKAFEPVTTVAAAELGAWRTGRLVYRDTGLLDLITDANRYFDGTISLAEQDLANLRVTATIRTDQVMHLPDMLAQSLPITVQASAGNQFVLSRAGPELE